MTHPPYLTYICAVPYVKFENEGKTIACNAGINLRKLAKANKISVYSGIHKLINCHGNGMCTSCEVEIVDGNRINQRTRMEEVQLAGHPLERRLACQVTIHGNLTVRTHPPKWEAPVDETTETADEAPEDAA